LIKIPDTILEDFVLKEGSVLYFSDKTLGINDPHFFILLNKNPHSDKLILLVCSSSKITKVIRRRKHLSSKTLVEINASEYESFTVDSIVDCNVCYLKSPEEIMNKTTDGKISLKAEMDIKIIEKLREALLLSPLIEKSLKNILLL
jgi:hypothetical protein